MSNLTNIKDGINIEPTTNTPSVKGDIVYDSVSDKLKVYNGANDPIVTEAKAATLTNKTISGASNTLSNIPNSATTATNLNTVSTIVARDGSGNFSAGTVTANLTGNASGTAANITGVAAIANGGTGQTTALPAFNALSPLTTTGDILTYSSGNNARLGAGASGQALVMVGSSPTWTSFSGGINYASANPNAESGLTTGYTVFQDTAAAAPTNGNGTVVDGTPITITASTSSPLRNTYSFLITQPNSHSVRGEGVRFPFTIDSADQAKMLSVQFDFNASSTFVASSGATSSSSDIEMWVYDITNSVLIPISPRVIVANGANNFSFKGVFQTSSNSTSYRLLWYCPLSSANATGWQFKFDNLYIGPQTIAQGAPITDWGQTPWTPTGSFTNNTTYTGQWRRVGDNAEFAVKLAFTGAPNSTTLTVNLPSGLSVDTTKRTSATALATQVGSGEYLTAAVSPLNLEVVYTSTTSVQPVWQSSIVNGTQSVVTQASPVTIANGDQINLIFSVPILGWSSTTLMSSDTSTRVVTAKISGNPSGTPTGSTAVAKFPTVVQDVGSCYSVSTGLYTVSVSGYYKVSSVIPFGGTGASGSIALIGIYYNGVSNSSNFYRYTTSTSDTMSVSISDIIKCVAGDTLAIHFLSQATSPTYSGNTINSYVTFELITGPATVAATESVVARYHNTTAQTLTSSTAVLNFDTKDIDTHGAVTTGAAWKFTAPVTGRYILTVMIETDSTASADAIQMTAGKNSSGGYTYSRTSRGAVVGDRITLSVTDFYQLVAGDYIQVAGLSASGVRTLDNSTYIGVAKLP